MENYKAQQISGKDRWGKNLLAVIVKQTYSIDNIGNCNLADEQLKIMDDLLPYEHNKELLEMNIEMIVQKIKCDVVVKGKTRFYRKAKQFTAQIIIGNLRHTIAVQGNQNVFLNNFGEIQFSDIEYIEEVPLRYDFAYGGKDTEAEKKIELPPSELLSSMPSIDLYADSTFRYPRNPEGKGYLVEFSKTMIEQLEIPNLQDIDQLLTPSNILVGNCNRWFEMPIPFATDWISPCWFPRFAYTGLADLPDGNLGELKEMKMGWVDSDIYQNKKLEDSFNYRFFNGAHYALQLELGYQPKECKLVNIHPTQPNFTIKLPTAKPKIWVDGRKGTLKETKPVMHSIVIEPDEHRLSIVWCGSAPALRPYFPHELETMPFKVEW